MINVNMAPHTMQQKLSTFNREEEEENKNKSHHHLPYVHALCFAGASHLSTKSFSGSCQFKITKTVWEDLGERPHPHFICQGHLMGHTAPGRFCFWGASKWTCQMPQTGNRKLLLNDVKYNRLFQVRQKLRYFPCILTMMKVWIR